MKSDNGQTNLSGVPSTSAKRMFHRMLAAVFVLGWCWILMQTVHEFGHFVAAVLTGAKVQGVQLRPLAISGLVIQPNPSPLLVVWSGPMIGCLLPALLVPFLWSSRNSWRQQFLFFVGFCLITNGAYIGLGSMDAIGDCRVMLQHGSPEWSLITFGVVTSAAGLMVWHRIGSLKRFFTFQDFDRVPIPWLVMGIAVLIAWDVLAR